MIEWKNVPDNIEQYEGFVYLITNTLNGRMYIGKKFYWKIIKYPPLKGHKNKRHKKVENNWRDYYGSCDTLNKDILKFGKKFFRRIILQSYRTKWETSYNEAKLQFDKGVLLLPEYYNGIIQCRLKERTF